MTIKDWTKFTISLGVLVAISVLIWVGKVTPDMGVPVIAALLGYVFGNSHGVIESNSVYAQRRKNG